MSGPTARVRRVPRLARRLVRLLVAPERVAEVRADLADVFHQEAASRGHLIARVRYWREVAALLVWRGGRRRRGGPVRRLRVGDGLLHDLRHGARALLLRPGFSTVAILSLALGIGASTAMFSVLEAVVLRPLSLPRSEDVMVLSSVLPGGEFNYVSGPDFLAWRESLSRDAGAGPEAPFEDLAGFQFWLPTVVTDQGARHVAGARVSPWFFDMLDVHPALGREFVSEDDGTVPRDQVVLGHDLWEEVFGGDPEIVGRRIEVPPRSYVVVGVLPAGVDLPAGRDLWTPLDLSAAPWMRDRKVRPFLVHGRLAPGVSVEAARARLTAVAAALADEFPETNDGVRSRLRPLKDTVTEQVEEPLLLMQAAVALVLMVACSNVANLTLAAGAARRQELSVYAALGATRGRLVRRMLVESALVAGAGGALGLVLAGVGLGTVRATVPVWLPRLDGLALDGSVLRFALACTACSVLAAGLVPALRAGPRATATGSRVTGGSGGWDAGGGRLARALLLTEFALSAVLLVGAGLFLRTLSHLRGTDLGLRVEGVQTLQVSFPGLDPVGNTDDLLDTLAGLPGVRSAVATSHVPVSGQYMDVEASLRDGPQAGPAGPRLSFRMVSPGYRRALAIPLLSGRDLEPSDGPDGRRVALVNETAARRYWPGSDPVGRLIALEDQPNHLGEDAWIEIVGVIGDVRHFGPAAEAVPELYVPYAQAGEAWTWTARSISLLLITDGVSGPSERQIRQAVRDVDPGIPVYRLASLEEYLGTQVQYVWLASRLLELFASLALVLAAVGIYGVVSCVVRRRTRDIGVRMALGARRERVLVEVLADATRTAAAGGALGLVAAVALAGLVRHLLHGVEPTDAATLAATVVVLLLTAAVAAYVPARRASRLDPARVLRGE